MGGQKASSSREPARSSGTWTTEYVVLKHTNEPDTREQNNHSHYCGAFRNETNAVDYLKRLMREDPLLVKSQSPIIDLTSELEPQRSYDDVDKFLTDKEALNLIYSREKYIGLGYHYRDSAGGKERVLWIQETRGIAY